MTAPWLFRVASHPSHGGGHVARSGVLAKELSRNAPVTMVLDPDSPDACERFEAAGLTCVSAGEEGRGPWAGAVVDGYQFRTSEASKIAGKIRPMVWIDDFLDPPDGSDLVVNGACHLSGDMIGNVPALLGPQFALIDLSFAALPDRDRARPIEHVLITFGRLDPDNAAGLALDALERLAEDGFRPAVTVVSAAASSHHAKLRERSSDRVSVLTDIANMTGMLAKCDLIIGAGGVSLHERMAAGVPSATVSIADNQRLFVAGAAEKCATLDAGDISTLSVAQLAERLRPLTTNAAYRVAMSTAGRRLVDGLGAQRVAKKMLALIAGRGGADVLHAGIRC